MNSMTLNPPSRQHRLRNCIWVAGITLALVISALITMHIAQEASHPRPLRAFGFDFLPSYAAGKLALSGRSNQLYDTAAFTAAENRVIESAGLEADARFAQWLNPPLFAWVFAPLTVFSYSAALGIWVAINLVLIAAAVLMLSRILIDAPGGSGASWKTWGLVPLCIVTSLPFWQAFTHQQNSFLSLALLCIVVSLWRKGRSFCAGAALALLFYKPQLAIVVAAMLAIDLGFWSVVGLASGGAVILALHQLVMPGALSAWIHGLPPIVHRLQQELPFNWGRQVTFQGVYRLLIQGHVRGGTTTSVKLLAAISAAVLAMTLLVAALSIRRWGGLHRDRLIIATLVSMPLLSPYFMDYDLLLLSIAAVLFAREIIQNGNSSLSPLNRRLIAGWIALFAALLVNPAIAGQTRVTLAVPLIALVAALSLARCLRRRQARGTITRTAPPLAQAA